MMMDMGVYVLRPYLIDGTDFIIDADEDAVRKAIGDAAGRGRLLLGRGVAVGRTVVRYAVVGAAVATATAVAAAVIVVVVIIAVLFVVLGRRLSWTVDHGRQDGGVGQEAGQQSNVKRAIFVVGHGQTFSHSAGKIRQTVQRGTVLERLVGSMQPDG